MTQSLTEVAGPVWQMIEARVSGRAHRIASQPSVEREKVLREALEVIRLIVEGETYKVTVGQQPCWHTAALDEIHEVVETALATPVVGVGDED